jgi:hypothetical protein
MVVSIEVMENPTQAPAPLVNGELGGSKEAENGAAYVNNGHVHGQNLTTSSGGGSMLAQQVYVSSGVPTHPAMVELQDQFMAMGMGSADPLRGPEDEVDDEYDLEGDNDEETSDEEPLKLFVGQVRLALIDLICIRSSECRMLGTVSNVPIALFSRILQCCN